MRTGSARPGRYTSSNRLARLATQMSSRPSSSSTRTATPSWPLPPSMSKRFGGDENRLPPRAPSSRPSGERREPPGEHLFHRREVVLTVLVPDLEAPVVGPLREPVLHHDHRADDLGALEVRDVEALDAQRRLRQVERVLQRRERASAGVVVRRTLELVLGERFVRVVRDGLEELTLVAALRHAHSHLGAPQQSEELLVELEVLGRPRHEHLARNVVATGVAVELFEELAHELGCVDVLHLVDDETL